MPPRSQATTHHDGRPKKTHTNHDILNFLFSTFGKLRGRSASVHRRSLRTRVIPKCKKDRGGGWRGNLKWGSATRGHWRKGLGNVSSDMWDLTWEVERVVNASRLLHERWSSRTSDLDHDSRCTECLRAELSLVQLQVVSGAALRVQDVPKRVRDDATKPPS